MHPVSLAARKAILLTLALLGLSGCAPIVAEGQPDQMTWVMLAPDQSAGQTFVAEYRGLSAVDLYLQPGTTSDGSLHLSLFENPSDDTPTASAHLPLASLTGPGFYRLSFDALTDSSLRSYYLALDIEGAGDVALGSATGGIYTSGALYLGNAPVDGQLTFRPLYDPPQIALGLAGEASQWALWMAVAVLLFALPGWALLHLRASGLSWFERAAMAGSIGVALYPVLFMIADLVGVRGGRGLVWVVPALALIYIVWRAWRTLGARAEALRGTPGDSTSRQARDGAASIALAGIVALVVITRFFAIRMIDVPTWGDSVQHTVMAQRMFENGGLFDSWMPYAPYSTLTVQFGFPAIAALYMWALGMASPQAVLVAGQVLNLLAVAALYPVATRLARGNPWAGVWAVLVAGLLSPMPAFYVNWGRYAQLAGLASLPAALWLVWDALEENRARWRRSILVALVIAGTALAYYRMTFFVVAFCVALLLVWAPSAYGNSARRWGTGLRALALIALLSGALFLPWAIHVAGSPLAASMEGGIAQGGTLQAVLAELATWKDAPLYVPPMLIAVSAIALAWAAWRKAWSVVALGAWAVLLALYNAGRLIHLPGANMMQSFAVMISVFIPVGWLCGWLVSQVAAWVERRTAMAGRVVLVVSTVALGVWGAWQARSIPNPALFGMVTRPDLRAMAWIRENTPADARFLVEGFRIYNGRSAVGSDAGWWLPLLAGRANTMPPQYALLNERPNDPDYAREVVELVARLEVISPASPEGMRLLCDEGITHVYIGQGQGLIGSGVQQLFAPEDLASQSAFDRVYHEDRVHVYAFERATCPTP